MKGKCLIVALMALVLLGGQYPSLAASKGVDKDLTIERRMQYQRAVEQIFWNHRLRSTDNPDLKPRLEEVITGVELRKKVEDYLQKSYALDHIWHRPITGQDLQEEINRMVENTIQPEVLEELFAALDHDPTVIAECLARPYLANRLVRQLYQISGTEEVKTVGSSNFDDWWKATEANNSTDTSITAGYIFVIPIAFKAKRFLTGSWNSISITGAPSPRDQQTVVWTGTEMIVWGGYDGSYLNTGGRYQPSTDSWLPITLTGAPAARCKHTAVWTGTEMIVWGGGQLGSVNTGGRYNPATDTWTATTTTGAPVNRRNHSAIWTGTEMIVWGGYQASMQNTGGRYNPSTDTWLPTSTSGAPSPRQYHTAVWTGSQMIIWGGDPATNSGGKYSPTTDSWTGTTTTGAPTNRYWHIAVWSGSTMMIWGGYNGATGLNTGGTYDPSSDTWTVTTLSGTPSARRRHTGVWSGTDLIIWGGTDDTGSLDTGGQYNPTNDSWMATETTNAPSGRLLHTAVWTGSQMIVWGGADGGNWLDTGAAYTPSACTPPSITTQPASQSITSGQTATLTVVATGTAPLSYQWYRGTSGNTSNPVGTNSNTYTTPALTSTTSYWVRVSNSCGQADSNTATVTVGSCVSPSITSQPANQTIDSGQTATLSVSANGTAPLAYQWYQGSSGNTSTPVGSDSPSFTTPPLTTTTQYWVRISNSCGHADSVTSTVTVRSCIPPSITTQPRDHVVSTGETATLVVAASGSMPLSFQWYQGTSGDISNPVGADSPTYVTPPLTTTTEYWVRIGNACGTEDSVTVTVTIGLTVTVDAAANQHAISPLIYGLSPSCTPECNNPPDPTVLHDLNCPLYRQGGNPASRYNWEANADNRGKDWFFESIADSSSIAGERGDTFFSQSRAGGAEPILTIPLAEWIAKVGSGRSTLWSFSRQLYGEQTAYDPAQPDAGNGVRLSDSGFIAGNNPNDANVPSTSGFQQGWVQHLIGRWGTSENGGVRFYIMDNEPSYWFETHRDVQPTGLTMDDVYGKFTEYAQMVKSQDPSALILGPEEWGWEAYMYSGYDQQYAKQTGCEVSSCAYLPDRYNHANQDYLEWLLNEIRLHDQTSGTRLLDYFTVHYYPRAGEYNFGALDDTSSDMQEMRNRSTRSLWDPDYTEEGEIQKRVCLIRQMKLWVAENYPGTKTGITEYNWGAEDHINGATAQADILGIFGREGLDLATRWGTPAFSSPTYKAFKMYRNYDGARSTFGDISVFAVPPHPNSLSAFASVRSSDGALTIMLINKELLEPAPISVAIHNFNASSVVEVWQLTTSNTITRLADVPVTDSHIYMGDPPLPPQSITLLVVHAGFSDGFDDGALDDDWDYAKGSWSETGGNLVGTPTGKKAVAIASPCFPGCSVCTIAATMMSAGGPFSKLWLLGWYQDKRNTIEVLMNEPSDKWILRQRVNGVVTAKASAKRPIEPNVFYSCTVTYNGENLTLSVDGTAVVSIHPTAVARVPASLINGTVGFQVKNTTGAFGGVSASAPVLLPCAPAITSHPVGKSITSGEVVVLSVIATGQEPLTYRWYQGATGDTSSPVGTDSFTYTTPPLTATTQYWVRVTNACGTANSETATINLGSCTFSGPRKFHTAVVANGHIYVLGGLDSSGNFLGDVQYASIQSTGYVGPWTTTTSFGSGRYGHGSAIFNNHFYLIAGWNTQDLSDVLYSTVAPDGSVSNWTPANSIQLPGRGSFGSVVNNGFLYVIGGVEYNSTRKDVQYASINSDGSLGPWAYTTALPNPSAGLAAVAYNGYLYVLGGTQGGAGLTNTVLYAPINADGSLGLWNTTASFSWPRLQHTAVAANGYMYIIAGDSTGTGAAHSDVQYAPINPNGTLGGWTFTTDLPFPRFCQTSVVWNGRVYVLGGATEGGLPGGLLNDVISAVVNPDGTLGSWQ